MKTFEVMHNPIRIYNKMLEDIASAKDFIYLETYIYDRDSVGNKFRDALLKKAKEGIKIKILVDAWGSTADKKYFSKLVKNGAEVRFFREFKYVIRIFSKNHERNHRKLLILDNNISYIGSMNITESCLDWRELVLRMEGDITEHFTYSFMQSWDLSGKITGKIIKKSINKVIHKGFEIIQDTPDIRRRDTERKYIELIRKAKTNIYIETPYFVPSSKIRHALARAVKKGVEVKLILPYASDVRLADIIRNRYLGSLYKKGVKIFYYKTRQLHSKLLIVDKKFFILGSSNLDYRSFIHQYEINLLGKDENITKALKVYFCKTLAGSIPFDYNEWKSRSSLERILESLLSFVRKYL